MVETPAVNVNVENGEAVADLHEMQRDLFGEHSADGLMAPVIEEDSNMVETQRASVAIPQPSQAMTVTVYDPAAAAADQHTASQDANRLGQGSFYQDMDALNMDESIE